MAITPQDIVTPNVMIDMQAELKEAREDTTPHIGVAGDELLVMGDANKTENKKHDYKVLMRYPKDKAQHIDEKDIIKTVGDYVFFEVEFKDVEILPRKNMQVVASIAEFLPFFYELREDGIVDEIPTDKLIQIAKELSGDILDSMYAMVGAFLNVKSDVYDYFMPSSVIGLTAKFINDFPEVFNEADFI